MIGGLGLGVHLASLNVPKLIGAQFYEPLVVTDEDNAALKLVDRHSERLV